MSLVDSIDSKSETPMSLLWGCELSSQRDSYTFQMPEEWQCEQQLALRTICLGETAQDEFHVVEIVEEGDARPPVPLATLKPSVLPMATLSGVELTPPVTFHLRAGSGPVYISGQHVSMLPNLSWNKEEEEDAEEEKLVEESLEKPPEGQTAKRWRLEEEEDELKEASPEDPPPGKGRGSSQGRKAVEKK